jgi:hypothetical protein
MPQCKNCLTVLSGMTHDAVMTENALRKALNDKRLNEAWGFDALYADMVRVVGVTKAPSTATLRRFVANTRATRDTARHFIQRYVVAISKAKAA